MSQPDAGMPQTSAPGPTRSAAADEERVPLFGSWPAIHAAVIVCAIAVMALVALFSHWPF